MIDCSKSRLHVWYWKFKQAAQLRALIRIVIPPPIIVSDLIFSKM